MAVCLLSVELHDIVFRWRLPFKANRLTGWCQELVGAIRVCASSLPVGASRRCIANAGASWPRHPTAPTPGT